MTDTLAPASSSAGDPGAPKPPLGERMRKWRPSAVTGGAPIYPLVVLFGLNAVDELDREAYNILLPNIRDHFGLSIQGILTLTSVVSFFVLFLEIPIAHLADRKSRVKIASAGAATWGVFSFLTALAPTIPFFGAARAGANLGRAVNGATHRSLLSDYYKIDVRPAVFAVWNAANSVGQFIGPIAAGVLAYYFGWRGPFVIFAIPTAIFVFLAFRLREPVRGVHERKIMGADEETAETEEAPASMAEAWRLLWQVRSLRRIWIAIPVVTIPVLALRPLLQLFYADELGLNTAQRGFIAAIGEPFQFVGLFLGIPIATRLMRRNPAYLIQFLGLTILLQMVSLFLLVFTRNIALVVAMRAILSLASATTLPGLAAAFSLIIPPRVRSMGFTIGNIFVIPTLIVQPIIGALADRLGLQFALIMLCPVMAGGAWMLASAGKFIASDISKMRTSTLAMAEVRAARQRNEAKMLVVRNLDVSYGNVQVLFDVDFEVDEGEIVALLGTNGAGKSTLLKSISGLVEADAGAVIFDGIDMTYAPPNEVVARGVIQVPGGKGVFPTLSVAENLRLAGWLYRRDQAYCDEATQQVLEYFPILRTRWEQPAGNLSGGEQQMLTLGMAFIAKPRLLMIDELSLGLAPVIVEQLLKIVEAIRERGTTMILVEQSVNVALTVAETAYFMEKGEIRFNGPTAELLNRPDVLRSVFLEGVGSMDGEKGTAGDGGSLASGPPRARTRPRVVVDGDAAPAPVLETRGVTKSYGGIRAIDGIDLTLHEGEILGVIGPNGAGKTTLFDLISGFVMPDHGAVVFDGYDVTFMAPDARARLGLGRSFQDARLFPSLTVRQTIALALEREIDVRDPLATALWVPEVARTERHVTERVDELLEMMGLTAFRNKFISELSTGSRRIVDLACVLAHQPRAILFDEPSSGIAQRETEALGPLLVRIREATNASLLLIEHDMPLITSVADEIVALDLGAVVTRGTPTEVVNHPHVVSSYLGTREEIVARSGTVTTAPPSGGRRRPRRRSPNQGVE